MRILTDATCIKVLPKETLLIAIGNQLLLVFLTPNGRTHRTFAELPRLVDKIHGIQACIIEAEKYLVIIHAGREAYCTVLDCGTHTFSASRLVVIPEEPCVHPVPHVRRRLNDWISSIALLSSTQLCLVTSHGVAALLKRDDNHCSLQWDLIDKSPCEDGSTLYCSTITGRDWDNIIILSGTALGLLLIWSAAGTKDCRGRVLKSISAHNGVIFSIACDFASGLLTTTSDDRSIKFWNVQLSINKENCSKSVELREEIYCFAHTARVFQCRILNGANRSLVASIGEDSHLCLWTVDGNLVLKKRIDEGPTLWNMDYDPESATIFIAASNGNLHKYCIRRYFIAGNESCNSDHSSMLDISPVLSVGEHLAKIKYLSNGTMVAATNYNLVMLLNGNGTIAQTLERREDFKCSIVEVGGTIFYLAGGCRIIVYDVSDKNCANLVRSTTVSFLQEAFMCANSSSDTKEGTVRSLNFCSRSKNVAICDASGRCIVLDATLETIVSCHRIPHSAERWLTSFLVLNDELYLMADRSGHLYLFDKSCTDPVFKLTNVHGKLGITSISTIEEKDGQLSDGYNFKTTGHDGRICELFVNTLSKTLELLSFTKSTIGWIDRKMARRSLHTFYLGFNDTHFLMADETNEIYTQFDCGGGHRCWDFYYDQTSETFAFVFIQHKRLKKVQYTMRNNTGSELMLPRFNWHTRACNALQVARRGDTYLMFSGGEDNILRINVLNKGHIMEAPRKHLFNHISSIKTITLSYRKENDTLLVISAGGRAQICVTSVDLKNFRIKQEYEYMLLATDSDRTRWKTNRQSSFDPETKFMCATLLPNDRIVFGCSDGFVRIYQLSCAVGQMSLSLIKEMFYGRCILKIVNFDVDGTSLFVTMATDGLLSFWDASHPQEPFYQHRHHSSGVNAVDVKQLEVGKFVFATGGDDQSVTVSLLEIRCPNGKPQVQVLEQLGEKYLHTAQVTGLKLLDDHKMISVGVDQRVYVITFAHYDKLAVERTTNTCIADLKGVSFLQDDNELILYGCGIEIMGLRSI